MDCDRVFMVLTSGPFPTGDASDVEVELHLEQCPDCWSIAEALRPAHDVFEESVPACEGRHLPGYWGDAQPARTVMAQVQQTALQAERVQAAQRHLPSSPYSLPMPGRHVAAWRDVLVVGTFVLLVSSIALLAAWAVH